MPREMFATKSSEIYRFVIRKDLLIAAFVALILVAGGLFLGFENNKVIPVNPDPGAHYTQGVHNPLGFMSNWDGPSYIRISQQGYVDSAQTNFFPLYPLVIHIFNYVISSTLISALLVSWTFLIGAIYYYLKIVKHIFKVKDSLEALRGVAFFILFPTAIFMLATYTESLFAFLALGSIYWTLRRKYLPAGAFLLLCTAAHTNGVFVLVLIILMLIEQREKVRKILLMALFGLGGLVGYMIYLSVKFNNAFAFLGAQKKHGWLQGELSNFIASMGWINIIFLMLIVISVIYWWSRKKSFAIYSLLFLAIPLVGGQFGGFNRYVLMDFPVQLMLYERFRDSRLGYPICIGLGAVLWTYFLFQYAGGYVGG